MSRGMRQGNKKELDKLDPSDINESYLVKIK